MRLFSLAAQLLRVRHAYYAALESAQRGDLDVTGWLAFFLAQVEAAANAAEGTIATPLAKVRFWVRHQSTRCVALTKSCGLANRMFGTNVCGLRS